MELRTLIRLSSDVIAYYWPMRTFVHHNPLHGLEDLPFDEGVRRGRRLLGGNGYLPSEMFRDYFRAGRILAAPSRCSRCNLARRPSRVKLGAREITHLDVLRACLLGEISPPADDTLDALLARHPDRDTIAMLADHLSA